MYVAQVVIAKLEEIRMNIEVKSVTPSPMNAHQWLLQLACGHDKWVTCKSRPTRKTQYCADCATAARQQESQ